MPKNTKEFLRVVDILQQNEEKDFVQRIIYPDKYPKIRNDDGSVSTHRMAAEVDDRTGRWLVFPTILNDRDGLRDYAVNDVREAMREAVNRGDYIDFGDKKDDAIWFSKKYKLVWPEDGRPQPKARSSSKRAQNQI